MESTTGNVLKASDIKVDGRFQLKLYPSGLGRAKGGPLAGMPKEATQPQAKIVETMPEFVIIEITCDCGEKTHVKCEYAPQQPSEQQQSPEQTVSMETE